MKRVKNDRRKLNNSGFSLVEFLIAVAILGVVSLTIYSFMNTGARFYQRTSADADIQSEAQLVANTISDLIIDCEVNISYDTEISPGPGGGAPIHANGRILEISNSNYQFLIFHRDNNLFYLERRPNPTDPSQYEAYDIDNAELLAQNITEFEVDLSRVSGKGKGKNIVTFVMTYEKGGRSYRGNYQVNLRNAVTVSANNITPTTDQENLTKIMITPSPVYIEVKGKDNPHLVCNNSCTHVHCPAGQETKEFTANSDARNVGRTDIFNWRIEDDNGPVTTYAQPVGSNTEKKFIIRFGSDLTNIPSNFKVIAQSTIINQATGTYATGEAVVYFKKILNLNITPTRGVVNDVMDPESSAIFTANFTDYNLQPENKRCTWRLEYKVGTGGEWAVCNNSSIATGRSYGGTYSVQLGSGADETYSFRLTATSEWDSTWSAEYIFGVKEKPTTPGVNAPSRGVEIDLSAYFKTDAGSTGWINGMKNPYDDDMEIYWIDQFHSNDYDAGSDLFKLIKKDGKYYVYLDYGAYTHPSRPWEFYDSTSEQIQMVVYARSKNDILYPSWDGSVPWSGSVPPSPAWNGISTVGWHTVRTVNGSSNYYRQNVHWQLSQVEFLAGDYANRNIVIPKGGTYDVATKLIGYNITKKNLIGIYLGGMNVNAYEVGMMDSNPYLSVEYTGGLGNRYVLVEDVKYRLTAKNTDTYPTAPIRIMTTLEPYYNMKDLNGAPTEKIERNASFAYNVYIANVEGTGAYIQGPLPSVSDWSKWKVITGTNQDGSPVERTIQSFPVTVNIKAPTQAEVTFDVERNLNDQISYFKMKYNNIDYYWNSTYNCWKRMS